MPVMGEYNNLLTRAIFDEQSQGPTGTFVVGRRLTEVARTGSFEAKLASAYLSCSLVPQSSDLPRGSTNPVP